MPTQLRTRARVKPASRTMKPARSGSFAAPKPIETAPRESAVDARTIEKLPIRATPRELSRLLGEQKSTQRDGRDSMRIATLLGIQRSSGNYAVQRLLRRLDTTSDE